MGTPIRRSRLIRAYRNGDALSVTVDPSLPGHHVFQKLANSASGVLHSIDRAACVARLSVQFKKSWFSRGQLETDASEGVVSIRFRS